jgi:drug/metabolite transporter (DMT)-like permease
MLSLKVQIPFWICTLIWGTTWFVILGQLGIVPATWSVTYRFFVAGVAMFLYAWIMRQPIRLSWPEQRFAMLFGAAQFTLNFNFVYQAEVHITSGLVAILFALLIVPNTLLARAFLGVRPTGRFYLGSTVAMAGIVMLFVNEYRQAGGGDNVVLGIGLTLCAVLSASVANVLQATPRARQMPMASMLAWGMLWGTLIDGAWAWLTTGPPVFDWSFTYVGGVLYLGLAASALAFMAYFKVIRLIGPGPAAYSSIITPVIAMAISTAFENYRWTAIATGGGLLALAGLSIALSARRPDLKSA